MGNALLIPTSACTTKLVNTCHASHEAVEERREHTAVFLNVYDLNEDWLQTNNLFRDVLKIGGAFHTGIQVHEHEWSYGQHGVSSTEPRMHQTHIYRQSILMGTTRKSASEVLELIKRHIIPRWQGSDYDLLRRNCCTFADFLCMRLVRKRIPGWVSRFSKMASHASSGLGKVVDIGSSASDSNSNEASLPGRSLSLTSRLSDASAATASSLASLASTSASSSEADSSTPRSFWAVSDERGDEGFS